MITRGFLTNADSENKRLRGSPLVSSTYPEAVGAAANFIKQNGFQADVRRRDAPLGVLVCH